MALSPITALALLYQLSTLIIVAIRTLNTKDLIRHLQDMPVLDGYF